MKRTFISIEDRQVEIIESNGNDTGLFLFHGNSSAADSFTSLLNSKLADKHRFISVSFPGHGSSDPAANADTDYTIDSLGQWAVKVVQHFDMKNYWVLGQSLGGHAILENLHNFGNALGIILISAPPISLDSLSTAFLPDPSGGLLFKGKLNNEEVEKFASCFSRQLNSGDRARMLDNIRKTDPAFRPALGASLGQGLLKNEIEAMANSRIPLALFGATDDQFLNPDYYAQLATDKLWKGRAQMFDECGHALQLECPNQVERLLSEFFVETSN